MSRSDSAYPVRMDAAVEPAASRGLWLVKWLLLIPHFLVLMLLWLVFAVFSVIAFFAILLTARYPRTLFEFNVGVLRWSWRVHYYGYAALGTDRYPPFTLADVPDYPARVTVPYPERLSRGLVLVKWLLAVPHYIVLALFVGGGIWLGTAARSDARWAPTIWGAGGLVGILVLIAAIALLFTGRYPRALYDFVLGMDRWALRVGAYTGLMTDRYPPFRLDMGGTDPGSGAAPPPPAPLSAPGGPAEGAPPAAQQDGWTGGRVVAVVFGALLLFVGSGGLVAGGGLLWADVTQRDQGYLTTSATTVATDRYALVADGLRLHGSGVEWTVDRITGTMRLRAEPVGVGADLFLGLGRTAEVQRYLDGVGYTRISSVSARWERGVVPALSRSDHAGSAPALPPASAGVWAASVGGPGTQTLTWRPSAGDWTAVIMRADGTPGVTARVQLGATLPGLTWVAGGALAFGAVLLAGGGVLIGGAVHRASRSARRRDDRPGGQLLDPALVPSGSATGPR